MPKQLLELIQETEHVSEVARLLSAFKKRHNARFGKIELIELANRTAGATYRYPNPESAIKLAVSIGLLQKDNQSLTLTDVGKQFLKYQGDDKLALTFDQASLFLGLFLDDRSTNNSVKALFKHFVENPRGQLHAKSTPSLWDTSTQTTARLFQQLGIFEEDEGKLFLNRAFESILPPFFLMVTALNEQALWDRLEAQRIRARQAEELVLVEEQKRLIKMGRAELAKLVVRVSAENVSAGYDIASFEHDGSPRLIEVKSSIGRAIRFEWSVKEREVAADNNDRYWIYFVPLANMLQNRIFPILMLNNPISLISSTKLIETPSSFVVYDAGEKTASFSANKSRVPELLKDWPNKNRMRKKHRGRDTRGGP